MPFEISGDEVSGDDVLAPLVDFSTLSTFCVMVGALYLETATASQMPILTSFYREEKKIV